MPNILYHENLLNDTSLRMYVTKDESIPDWIEIPASYLGITSTQNINNKKNINLNTFLPNGVYSIRYGILKNNSLQDNYSGKIKIKNSPIDKMVRFNFSGFPKAEALVDELGNPLFDIPEVLTGFTSYIASLFKSETKYTIPLIKDDNTGSFSGEIGLTTYDPSGGGHRTIGITLALDNLEFITSVGVTVGHDIEVNGTTTALAFALATNSPLATQPGISGWIAPALESKLGIPLHQKLSIGASSCELSPINECDPAGGGAGKRIIPGIINKRRNICGDSSPCIGVGHTTYKDSYNIGPRWRIFTKHCMSHIIRNTGITDFRGYSQDC